MSSIKKQRLAFIDTETTGLDALRHEIIELGCVIVDQDWDTADGKPKFEIVEEFEFKIKPERIHEADKIALRVNGYDPSQWVFAHTLSQAMEALSEKTSGAIMVAHNLSFDYLFLDKAFHTTGVENKMHYHRLDTISIAFAKLHGRNDIDQFSLRALCVEFGIENKSAHTALSDARATFHLYQKLMQDIS